MTTKRKQIPQHELEAYCQVHGHSWIKVAYSSYRRCSWCGTYEKEAECSKTQATLFDGLLEDSVQIEDLNEVEEEVPA